MVLPCITREAETHTRDRPVNYSFHHRITQFGRQTSYGQVRIRKASMQNTEGPLCKFHACCNAEHLSHYRSISIIERQLKRERIWHTPHFIGSLVVVPHAATDALGRRYEGSAVRDYSSVPDVVAKHLIRGTTRTHFINCQGFMYSWN